MQSGEKDIYLDGHIAFGNFPHIETHSRNHVFCELAGLEEKRKDTIIAQPLLPCDTR